MRIKSWTFQEWCRFRRLSRSTGYRLMRAGEIKTYKIGKRRFVSPQADYEFMRSRGVDSGV